MAKRTVLSFALLIATFLAIFSGFFVDTSVTHAASYCQVTYTVTNQWSGGFGANITLQNTSGSAWSSWTLAFAFPASGQTITQSWNGTFTQTGQNVTVTNMSYNGSVPADTSVNPGFNGAWTSSNPVPTSFTVNGNACNDSGSPTPTATPTATPTSTPTSTSTATPTATPISTPTSTPTSLPTPTPTPGTVVVYAVNAGGTASGSFIADAYSSGGSTYATTSSINTSGVSNPAPQAVYQTERYGNFTYTLPGLVPGAQYTVRLHEAETYWTSAGQRSFNVSINGQQVLSNVDIYATAGGANKAVIQQLTITANASGQIIIQFTTVKDNAKVNGIEILGSGAIPTPTPTPTSTPVSGSCPTGSAPSTSYALGTRMFNFYRGTRYLRTEIWYPRTGTGGDIDSAAIASGSFPLVLFSHGFGGNPPSYADWIRPLAQAGFIVAAPWYPNTSYGSSMDGSDVVNQPLDASYIITQVLNMNTTPGDPFNGHVRTTCGVGAAGHSAGAGTTHGLLSIDRDSRVTAAVLLAGYSMGTPTNPPAKVLNIHGTNDQYIPYSSAQTMYNAYGSWPKAFLTENGGTHDDYVFLSGTTCAPTCGRGYAQANATSIDWMRYALYGDMAAKDRLSSDAASSITSFTSSGL